MPAVKPVPTPGQRAWWLLPELVALMLLAVLIAGGVQLSAAPAGSTFHEQLAARITAALEAASPAEHHDHGHEVQAGWSVVCGAEVYGTDPRNATEIGQVQTVYGYFMCAAGAPGTPFDFSSRITGPCVLHLADPPVVTIAKSGQGYDVRVREMMPDEYEAFSFGGFRNKEIPTQLRDRYNRTVAAAPAPSVPSSPSSSPSAS